MTGCLYNCAYLETLIIVNTTLSASASALTVLLLETWRGAPGSIAQVLNGVLAGERMPFLLAAGRGVHVSGDGGWIAVC
jgi:hypothetical protein